MNHWGELSAWREHRRELLREAQERQLEREARKIREAFAHSKKRPGAVEVRWGLLKDEAKVAELLELNGMPRWVAYEDRFVVAEKNGRVLGALRYRTESKRLLLGLLVVGPWACEERVAAEGYRAGRYPTDVVAADLGGNKRPDLAVANLGPDNVSVLVNATGDRRPSPGLGG